MSNTCTYCPDAVQTPATFDILRGVGLAVSVAVILVVPTALALIVAIHG